MSPASLLFAGFVFFISPLAWSKVSGAHYFATRYLKDKVADIVAQSAEGTLRVQRIKSQLTDEYRRHGFRDAIVNISNALEIEILEGPQYLISQIEVNGPSDAQSKALVDKIKELLKEVLEPHGLNDPASVFVDGYDVLDERALIKIKGLLLDDLRAKGFLEASLIGPKLQFNLRPLVAVSYSASLGQQTKIASIVVDTQSLEQTPDLRACIDIEVGEPLIASAVETPRSCIEEYLWNHGYLKARVDSDIQLSPSDHTAHIRFGINPGPLVHIVGINVRGNESTRTESILSRSALRMGDLYSLQKIADTRLALTDSDIFDRIDIFVEPDGDETTQVLVIDVHERPRLTFELGVGASLEDGPRLSLLASRRNLFGLGIGLKTRTQVNYPALFYRFPFLYSEEVMKALESRFEKDSFWMQLLLYTEARMTVSLEYPSILNFWWNTDGSANLSINRELKAAYSLNRASLDSALSFKPSPQLRLGPFVEFEYGSFFCPTGYRVGLGCGEGPTGAATRWIDRGETQQATLRFSGAFDKRDSITRPRKGFFVDANADFGLGRADLGHEGSYRPIRYAKLQTSVSSFWPLSRTSVGFLSLRLGQIFELEHNAYVPLFKRFYLGGTNSLRGYAEEQILPADDANWPATSFHPKDSSLPALSLGGNFVIVARSEIRFRLSQDYDCAVFVDAGELLHSVGNFSLQALAIGAGFGIRYATPVGPLMLDLGMRVLDGNRAYDAGFWKLFGLHFSIGYF